MTMAHRSPQQIATLRLRALLAGVSLIAISSQAAADPVQPFWVLPAVLADATTQASTNQISLHRPDLRSRIDVDRPVYGQAQQNWPKLNSMEFKSSNPADPVPDLHTVSNMVSFQPSVSTRINRIADGLSFDGGVGAQVVSVESTMLDGSFNFTSDIIGDNVSLDTRDFRDPQLRETPREFRSRDVTRRHRFATKLLDTGNLKLMAVCKPRLRPANPVAGVACLHPPCVCVCHWQAAASSSLRNYRILNRITPREKNYPSVGNRFPTA